MHQYFFWETVIWDSAVRGVSGTFINGFYETGLQSYGETAYGFPEKKQAMLNLPILPVFQ